MYTEWIETASAKVTFIKCKLDCKPRTNIRFVLVEDVLDGGGRTINSFKFTRFAFCPRNSSADVAFFLAAALSGSAEEPMRAASRPAMFHAEAPPLPPAPAANPPLNPSASTNRTYIHQSQQPHWLIVTSGYNGTTCDGSAMCIAWKTPVCQNGFYGENIRTVDVVLPTRPRNNGKTRSRQTSRRISPGTSTVPPAGRQPVTWQLSAVLDGGCGMTSLASSDVVMIPASVHIQILISVYLLIVQESVYLHVVLEFSDILLYWNNNTNFHT